MCGIAGFIGESRKPSFSYQLITKLFQYSESRGVDAAGYWGTETGKNGRVFYHKEPCKSSDFIKKDVWKQLCNYNPSLLLVHARGASKGVGEPHINSNNHPFTNTDKSIGLIHNGRIDDTEYYSLKKKYNLNTQCDSEVLLRIFESGEESGEQSDRLAGIKDIFSFINEGHMAVAIGERGTAGERMLWLFRNCHRPLWIVDVRETLGQVFFVSEPSIWEWAISECVGSNFITKTQKLIELPTEEVWYFKIASGQPTPKGVQRYKVCKNDFKPWQFDGKIKFPVPVRCNAQFEVITRLDKNDKIIDPIQAPQKNTPANTLVNEQEELSSTQVNKKCNEIVKLIENIRIYTEQLIQEQSMSKHDYDQLMEDLEQQRQDLEGLNAIISG